MTNAPMAALNLTAQIADADLPGWAQVLGRRVSKPASVATGLRAQAQIGVAATVGWVGAETTPLDEARQNPPEGHGSVGRLRGAPVAVSQTDGVTCAVSAICTHLGGIVRYNEHERSWDCPLHGSRFAVDGTVLEGPATSPLAPVSPADTVTAACSPRLFRSLLIPTRRFFRVRQPGPARDGRVVFAVFARVGPGGEAGIDHLLPQDRCPAS